MLNFICIGVFCHPCGKNCRNVAIATKFSHFGGLLCPPLYQSGPIWQQTVDPISTLTRQISFESVYCVTFQGQKRIVGQILTLGAPVPSPLTDTGQILRATADPRCTLTCQISSRSVNYVDFWRRKPPNIAGFFGVRHFVMSPIGGVRRKLNASAQLQTFLQRYQTISIFEQLHGEIVRRNCIVRKRDGQTNKQTNKNSTFLATPAAA